MKRVNYITIALWLLTGCAKQDDYVAVPDGGEAMAHISIVSKESDRIGSRAVNDDDIQDVHFFIFDTDGALQHHEYVDATESIRVSLVSGRTYRFYAVTNTLDASLFSRVNTEEILKGQVYTLPDRDHLEQAGLLMMSGYDEVLVAGGGSQQNIAIPVYRIAAKIDMRVKSLIPGFEVTDMYLFNVPSKSYYCKQAKDVEDKGIYTGETPLAFDAENKVTFYMLENRAGGRVKPAGYTGNDGEQKEKRKYAPENATYVRIDGTFTAEGILYTTKHWVYLGHDNSKDYNVGRNESHTYIVTIKGIGESDTDTRVEITEEQTFLGDELDPANSYIVDKPGNFKIDAKFMGNRTDQQIDITDRNVSADYLWTSVPGAVTDVRYNAEDSCIYFSLKSDPQTGEAYRGNTVVALYDEDTKEILWSWHLWLTETPAEVVVGGECAAGDTKHPADAAKGKMIIMDRNLGAVSASPADGWKTFGCYYQMGRKDPFIGTDQNGTLNRDDLSKGVDSKGDINKIKELETPFGSATQHTEWNGVLAPGGWTYHNDYISAREGVRYPMTLASGNKGPWTTVAKNQGDLLFASKGGHEDYWNRTKTINDPCPSGWTVLGERGGKFFGKDALTYTWNSGNEVYGMTSKLSGYDEVWWPAAGSRSMLGTMSDVGFLGVYAQYDHVSSDHGAHCMYFGYNEKRGDDTKTNHAASIRCVKVKQGAQ